MLATAGQTIARDELKPRRRVASGLRNARREMDAEALAETDGGYTSGRKRTGVRLTFHGGLPETVWGRIASGLAFLLMAAIVLAGVLSAEHLVLRDRRFVVADSAAIGIEGLHHLSRAEVLRNLDGTVGQNIFRLSLDRKRAQLEAMPWVEHATVMRLLPDHLTTVIAERTPVAFARNGNRIDLVDTNGVLLAMNGAGQGSTNYSFPVVTGIAPSVPLSVRSSRMKIFGEFTSALDAGGERLSTRLSEVDLSDPEDVRAVVPESGADILVHFGDSGYLDRFRRFEKLLPEWRAQYPKLASVDMRYERQVVLEMQPGAAAEEHSTASAPVIPPAPAHTHDDASLERHSATVAKHTGRPPLRSGPSQAHHGTRAGAHHTAVAR